ncbi:MAG: ABC transporter permease, partial [Owenweeksia sp.]
SEMESKSGSPVAIIGADIAEGLFGVQQTVDKEISMLGRKVRVLGVFKKQGKSLVGQDVDATILIPVNFARTLMNVNNQDNAFIMAAAKPGVEMEALKDELRGAMRSVRRLKPRADDNFALNEISVLSNGLDMMFSIIGGAGAVIGMFSILVGGFGIANIMFVSVRERTNQIGIQKSLGAKNYFILLQFLLESVALCLVGGCLGLMAVYMGILIAGNNIEFDLSLSLGNVFWGIGISALIGVVSGFIPAWVASRLNPVDAIRSGQ